MERHWNPYAPVVEMKNCALGVPQEVKQLPNDPVIPFLDIYPSELKILFTQKILNNYP